jgi:RND family efflux transporter MFP subunit
MKKTIIIAVIILILGGLTAWKLLENQQKAVEQVYKRNTNLKVLVKTAAVQTADLGGAVQLLGTFEPNKEVQVFAEIGGKVVACNAKEGDNVAAGALIAQLDDELLRHQLLAAEANYQDAVNDRKNFEGLLKGDAVTQNQLNKALVAEKNNESQVKILQKQLTQTQIKAPLTGVITMKQVENGAVISPNAPLVQITDISIVKLVINVAEKDLQQFRIGQMVEVSTELYPETTLQGTVDYIAVKGDNTHHYAVKILVKNSPTTPLRAGMYGSVKLANSLKTNAIVINKQAVVGSAKQPQVYVVENNKAVLKNVVLGVATQDTYEVIAGLQVGEQVVTTGQINLQNGAEVEIK